jgi:hypothetical protein
MGRRKKTTIHERLRELSDRALDRLRELVESEQAGLALKACDSILDRNPETARNQRVESNLKGRFTVDPVTLMHAALTARELDEAALIAQAERKEEANVLSAQQREGEPHRGNESDVC